MEGGIEHGYRLARTRIKGINPLRAARQPVNSVDQAAILSN